MLSTNNRENMQSIFLYSFKTILILLLFNFIVMFSMSKIVFNNFYRSNQDNIFSNIYTKINEMDGFNINSKEFKELIDICRHNNCTIEVYDSSTNKRLYSPYVYENDVFATVDSKKVFDGIIGENSRGVIIDGVNSNVEDQIAINSLNGMNNAYSLLIRKTDDIYVLVQTSAETRNLYSETLSKVILFVLSASSVVGIILAYFLSKNMLMNIVSIKNVAKRITNHDFSEKCVNSKFNEFFELGQYINKMSESLEAQMQEIESQNIKLQEDLKNREKLEISQKEFVSNVSHELKTPISIISGYAEGIKYKLVDTEEEKEKYCDTIINECSRMRNIVKQLLDLSKIENLSLDLQENDISKMLSVICDKFGASNPQRHLDTNINQGLIAVCDYGEIERVILNYLGNAVKYSKDDILLKAYKVNDKVHIGVISNGHIDEKDTERIWERFYRADKSHKRQENSTGLGLSIVKATMEKHGAPYGMHQYNEKVEFFIELPVC